MVEEDRGQHERQPSRLTSRQKKRFPIVVDAPDTSDAKYFDILGYLLGALGLVTAAVGGYFIIFGPEYIRYNVVTGMTFHQFLQAYPGPIATAGFVAVALGRLAAGHASNQRVNGINAAVEQALVSQGVAAEDLGDEYRLALTHQQDGRLGIDLVDNPGVDPGAEEESAGR